eukprot:NODE_1408_length_882_cov_93.524610_g1163_i0.p1 GENE.NODE_1408_length_882_cov_93.524610_g1163_i0~~NODE_1408_length_882_cov_93.524610_g1163_i0.p1  ORF type:complete len:257 (+),score=25.43 NODE_1408_length_882_cov_93.524610_g1163_i0:89-859(+)
MTDFELCFHTCISSSSEEGQQHLDYVKTPVPLSDTLSIVVKEDPSGGGGVGTFISHASLVMSRYFHEMAKNDTPSMPASFWTGKQVLELGCGTGIAGLSLALLPAPPHEIVLSDQAPLLHLARANLDDLAPALHCKVRVLELDWGADAPVALRAAGVDNVDVLIACDCVYSEDTVPLLVDTIVAVAPNICFLISRLRSKAVGELLHGLLAAKSLHVAALALPAEPLQALGGLPADLPSNFEFLQISLPRAAGHESP